MTSETVPAFQRRAFTKDAGDGTSCTEWTLTPTGLTDAVQIIAEPIATLFVDGKHPAGDGTVPVHSGNAPAAAGAQATYHFDLGDQGHEGAYRVQMVQRVALHAILRIAQTAKVLE